MDLLNWYVFIPIVVFLILCILYYKFANCTLDRIFGAIFIGLIMFLIIGGSICLYRLNHPNNSYEVVVFNKNYYISSNPKIELLVYCNGQVRTVRMSNLYKWEQVNVGDTITVKGYDEYTLQY